MTTITPAQSPLEYPPPFLGVWSFYSAVPAASIIVGGSYASGSIAWGGANTAKYVPVTLPWPYPVNRVWWQNGSAAGGNNDFGIYDSSGTKIYSTGSTAGSGNSVPQYVTPATPFVLSPGDYFFAFVADNTTANRVGGNAFAADPMMKMVGIYEQTSALPLPSSATFATSAAAGVVNCGVTWTTSGF